MRHNRIRTIFLASALTAAVASPLPAIAQTPYDGLWNVTIVTKTGSCEPSARSTLTVADGKISAAGADVSGSIGREGTCARLDQWCICERPAQWQRRIGEVEWGICGRTVQRSLGSVAAISRTRRPNLSRSSRRLIFAAATLAGGLAVRLRQLRAIGAVRRHGRQLVRRRHRHPRRRIERAAFAAAPPMPSAPAAPASIRP